MADFAVTRIMDNFHKNLPEGHEKAIALDGDRAFAFNSSGDVVSTKVKEGESEETVHFRLLAALTGLEISDG